MYVCRVDYFNKSLIGLLTVLMPIYAFAVLICKGFFISFNQKPVAADKEVHISLFYAVVFLRHFLFAGGDPTDGEQGQAGGWQYTYWQQ